MRYFSMFSGIGGFELGIQRAFDNRPDLRNGSKGLSEDNTDTTQPQVRAECIGYSEIDKYAIKVYERHFKHTNYGDATKINASELPDFDLLVGGFPCQAFSVAGKRKGFDDTRGTLFFDIARILAEKRPRHLVLENVKGLLSHDFGKTFQTILGVLSDLGYRVEWQVLNSKDFGVPQNRERIYFVGHLRGECSGQVFPLRSHNEPSDELSGQQAYTTTLTTRYNATGNGAYVAERKLNAQERKVKQVGQIYPNPHNSQAISKDSLLGEGMRIRRLTPKECERLQGFPDNWTEFGSEKTSDEPMPKVTTKTEHIIPISDTQRYKMCGNAVTVNVVQAVMERLFEHELPAA